MNRHCRRSLPSRETSFASLLSFASFSFPTTEFGHAKDANDEKDNRDERNEETKAMRGGARVENGVIDSFATLATGCCDFDFFAPLD